MMKGAVKNVCLKSKNGRSDSEIVGIFKASERC